MAHMKMMKLYIDLVSIFLLTLNRMDSTEGVVEISPSGVAPVCQAGDQLELRCSIPGVFIRWESNVPGAQVRFLITVPADGSSGVPPPIMVNSTRFTFSRLSTQPLTSAMVINNVSEGLNGVQMNCEDVETSESAMTTIRIVDVRATTGVNLSIQSPSEQFTSDSVIVLLEWTVSLSPIYYQQLLQNVSILVVPDIGVTIANTSVQLTLQYNREYSVSVTQPGLCGQPDQTEVIQLRYSKCSNPMVLTQNNVQVMGYEDPALEGESVMFTCASGLELNGPNSAICMGNGEWEPAPGEVNCTENVLQPINPVICGHPLYVLEIKDSITIMTYRELRNSVFNNSPVCCSGILVIEADSMNCLEDELNTTHLRYEGCASGAVSDRLRELLISVACVLTLVSAAMLVIGFISGHCFSQRCRKSRERATSSDSAAAPNSPNEGVVDLELNKNVAYITLRPR